MNEIPRWIFASLFITSGIGHFVRTKWYERLMPPYLPWHRELVWLSGLIELGLGILLLVPRCSSLAAWGLIALLVAVFPANIHMAATSGGPKPAAPGVAPLWAWARLPLQGVLIYWAYLYAR
ncbi:MAG: DoxX family membrane protein [Elusimicrobia bacterium]|nr:DoxX family membrane protein [Elusimicrobiota bacterium]